MTQSFNNRSKIVKPNVQATQHPMGLRHQSKPVAPPVYRPQPVQKVLQSKMACNQQTQLFHCKPATPPAYRPVQKQSVQPKPAIATNQQRIVPGGNNLTAQNSSRVSIRPTGSTAKSTIQQPVRLLIKKGPVSGFNEQKRFSSPPRVVQQKPSTVQQIKFYPNLHPGAAVSVDRDNIFRLNNFADQYRLNRINSHGAYVPNLKYNFVKTREGDMLLHNRYRHPSLAEGKQVLYAGEVTFNNGKLNWWSNGSGHYQPDEDYAKQAGLPMDHFYSYQQVLKGEHERKKPNTDE